MNLLLGLFTFILVLTSVFLVLVILAQRAKNDGGMGAALGGGMTEAAFGAESGNVLTRATNYAAIAFFVIAFGLFLGHLYLHRKAQAEAPATLPDAPELIAAPAEGVDPAASALDTPQVPAVSFTTEQAEEAVDTAVEGAEPAAEDLMESSPRSTEAPSASAEDTSNP